jgi:glycosyltransferase involved in cell wall biosynthesis
VVVVDNSGAGSERARVAALASQNAPVSYVHEPSPGIPFARNAALEAARAFGPAWIAFIDDDEVAPQGWLARLLQTAELNRADVVLGGLTRAAPADVEVLAAAWRPSEAVAEASPTSKAATNNVLLRAWLVEEPVALRFDENMRDTGGSDGEFFMRAADAGAILVRATDATVFEETSEEREAPAWLRRRAFRVGANCNYRYRKNRRPQLVAAALILGRAGESTARGVARGLLSLLVLPVSIRRAGTFAQRGMLDLCFAWGCIAPYFGVEPKRYT